MPNLGNKIKSLKSSFGLNSDLKMNLSKLQNKREK